MRVRAYIRRSHEREGGISLEVQREAIRAEVARSGWTLATIEYLDDDRSAFRDDLDNRPAIRQALEDAKQRSFDVLCVYKWDRLARSEAAFHGLIAQFKRLKVAVVSATENNDPLARSLSGLLAAEYSRILSRRMRDVRQWEAEQGLLVGPVPRGYDRRADGVAIQNAEAAMIREMGELYATGEYSVGQIAKRFDLHVDAVREMLRNSVYAGYIRCNGETYPGKHEPIWPAPLWERMQATAAHRSRRRTREPERYDPLLAGFIYCAHCGAPQWHNSTERWRYYGCAGGRDPRYRPYPDHVTCTHTRTPAEPAEQTILGLLASMSAIPSLLENVEQLLSGPMPKSKQRKPQIADLTELLIAGRITGIEFEERKRRRMESSATAVPESMPDAAAAQALLRDLPTLLRAATGSELRPVLRELITEVYTRKAEVVALRPTKLGSVLLGNASEQPEQWLKLACWWAGWGSNPRPSA